MFRDLEAESPLRRDKPRSKVIPNISVSPSSCASRLMFLSISGSKSGSGAGLVGGVETGERVERFADEVVRGGSGALCQSFRAQRGGNIRNDSFEAPLSINAVNNGCVSSRPDAIGISLTT